MNTPTGTVMCLTGQRINKAQRELNSSSVANHLAMLVQFFSQKLFATGLRRTAIQLIDNAIWFKGVSKEAWDDNLDKTQLKILLPQLDCLQNRLRTAREAALHLSTSKTTRPALAQAVEDFSSSATELFDAIESFKWTIKELDANQSPISEGFYAETPEGVENLFRQLQQPV